MSVQANCRCVRCVTKVPMGVTFCDDCEAVVTLFNTLPLRSHRHGVCWHCATPHAEEVVAYCSECGVNVAQTEEIAVG